MDARLMQGKCPGLVSEAEIQGLGVISSFAVKFPALHYKQKTDASWQMANKNCRVADLFDNEFILGHFDFLPQFCAGPPQCRRFASSSILGERPRPPDNHGNRRLGGRTVASRFPGTASQCVRTLQSGFIRQIFGPFGYVPLNFFSSPTAAGVAAA